jgi:ferredoxin-like protein FixX
MGHSSATEESFIKINLKRCNGCGNCIIVCGGEVFEMKRKKARVARLRNCLECGNCEVACVRDAITFQMPRGGKGITYRYG